MPGAGKILYYEVKEQIESWIVGGDLPVGSQLPSEPALTEKLNVSRGTIRQALGVMEREGTIARRSGVGTFVVRKPKRAKIVSFTQQVFDKGKKPSTQVVSMKLITANEAEGRVCETFLAGCDEPDQVQVYRIERLRLADDRPVAQQVIFLRVADFGPNLLEEHDFAGSIFQLYDRYHRRAATADEIIQARRPTEKETQILHMQDIEPNERLVYVRDRITYDDENLPLEVLISVDRSDFFNRYQYRILAD